MKNLNDLHDEANRLVTFTNWPLDFIDKKILARTGMYYFNKHDSVKCYFCLIEIGCWERTDDPVDEHLKFSPSCPLLRRRETDNVPINSSALDRVLPPISYDVCGNETKIDVYWHPYQMIYPEFEIQQLRLDSFANNTCFDSSLAQKLAKAGFFCHDSGSTDDDDKCTNRVLCFSCGAEIQNRAIALISNESDAWHQHVFLMSHCSFIKFVWGQKFINKVLASPTENNSENETSIAVASTKNTSVGTGSDNRLCKICFEEEYSVAFLPCGHVVVCLKCALSVSRCPICRTITNNIMRVYIS